MSTADLPQPLFSSREALLAWLLNHVAVKFPHQAILKGGMVLRLLDSPRYTNDADYLFVPFESRRAVAAMLVEALHQVPSLKLKSELNSKCLRIKIEYGGQQAQLEISVARECLTQLLTTASLSHSHGLPPSIVRVMALPVALAHKLAAWGERRLARDLYDAWFLATVHGILPDPEVLAERLSHLQVRRAKPRHVELSDFSRTLLRALDELSQEQLETELLSAVAPAELPGLALRIRSGLRLMLLRMGTELS